MATASSSCPVAFASLGTILIDNFRYINHDEERTERHLGGGGLYACAGARIWLPSPKIRMPIGGTKKSTQSEIFEEMLRLSAGEEDMWVWDKENEGRDEGMLQALIEYRGDSRSFRYLNPRPPFSLSNIPLETSIPSARYLHFCCSPIDLSGSLNALQEGTPRSSRPVVIYEPIPISCSPENLSSLKSVLPSVDIFSPNHEELDLFLSPSDLASLPEAQDTQTRIESLTALYHSFGARTVVVRAGSLGCFISNQNSTFGALKSTWLPPYWTEAEARTMVKGTTGAGNSFLGGLGAGLHLAGNDIFEAATYGSVSASFIIQQAGLPVLTATTPHAPDEESEHQEMWNGELPSVRLRRYE